MPEFVLDFGSKEGAKAFQDLDSFTQGYVEALFFTNTGTGDDEELEHATFSDLAPDTLSLIVKDCAAFQADNEETLSKAYEGDYEDTQAGRDFWFTRNGHGVGYWDRSQLPEDLQERLTYSAQTYGEVDLYKGDDDLLYLT